VWGKIVKKQGARSKGRGGGSSVRGLKAAAIQLKKAKRDVILFNLIHPGLRNGTPDFFALSSIFTHAMFTPSKFLRNFCPLKGLSNSDRQLTISESNIFVSTHKLINS
jgi:hypothetical protein